MAVPYAIKLIAAKARINCGIGLFYAKKMTAKRWWVLPPPFARAGKEQHELNRHQKYATTSALQFTVHGSRFNTAFNAKNANNAT
jgi:hypothetical protein